MLIESQQRLLAPTGMGYVTILLPTTSLTASQLAIHLKLSTFFSPSPSLLLYKACNISISICTHLKPSTSFSPSSSQVDRFIFIRKMSKKPTPHRTPVINNLTVHKEGNNWIFEPQALQIMWGGDRRYWDVPEDTGKPVELRQVSWLEVTGKLELSQLGTGNKKVIFKLQLKPDAFGWNYGPLYFTAQPGRKAQYVWRAADLSTKPPGEDIKIEVPFTVDNTDNNDKLLFGIYEVWNGRWKGGLVIKEVVIQLQ